MPVVETDRGNFRHAGANGGWALAGGNCAVANGVASILVRRRRWRPDAKRLLPDAASGGDFDASHNLEQRRAQPPVLGRSVAGVPDFGEFEFESPDVVR